MVLDDSGWEYQVELRALGREKAEGTVLGKALSPGEPGTGITLYQALLKGSSFELVLQKGTEIGVSGFVPIICDRCVAADPGSSRLSRWHKVILEAAQQSRRGRLPALQAPTQLRAACESAKGISLFLWEDERKQGLRTVLRSLLASGSVPEINIFAGPEGGFSPGEVDIARSCGIEPVTTGHRILRAETAGLVAAALALYECGDLGDSPETTGDRTRL